MDGDGRGNGMVDAAIAAIAAATGVSGTLTDFNVSSVTGGGDALGDVVVQLEVDGLQAPAGAWRPTWSRRRRGRTRRGEPHHPHARAAARAGTSIVGP